MKEVLLSRFMQLAVRALMVVFAFLAGKFGIELPTDQLTGSAEFVASGLAVAAMWLLDTYIHRKREDAPAAVPYHESPLIAFLLLPGLLMLAGCVQSTAEAKRNNENQAFAATNYQRNVERLVYALIDDMCESAYEKADALAADAVKGETGPDGKASAKNLKLIQDKKLEHYKQIEVNRIALRSKLIEAAKDMDHLREYSKALSDYWEKSASTAGLLNQSSEAVIQMLDKFVKGPKAQVIRTQ